MTEQTSAPIGGLPPSDKPVESVSYGEAAKPLGGASIAELLGEDAPPKPPGEPATHAASEGEPAKGEADPFKALLSKVSAESESRSENLGLKKQIAGLTEEVAALKAVREKYDALLADPFKALENAEGVDWDTIIDRKLGLADDDAGGAGGESSGELAKVKAEIAAIKKAAEEERAAAKKREEEAQNQSYESYWNEVSAVVNNSSDYKLTKALATKEHLGEAFSLYVNEYKQAPDAKTLLAITERYFEGVRGDLMGEGHTSGLSPSQTTDVSRPAPPADGVKGLDDEADFDRLVKSLGIG